MTEESDQAARGDEAATPPGLLTSNAGADNQSSWAALDRMRVGKWGELLFGMALSKAGLDTFTPLVDDRSIDLLARLPGEPIKYVEFQIKTVRLVTSTYIFAKKRLFGLGADRYVGVVVLVEGKAEPAIYIIPSMLWLNPQAPFVARDYEGKQSEPEYGLTISSRNLHLLEQYRFERQVALLTSARDGMPA